MKSKQSQRDPVVVLAWYCCQNQIVSIMPQIPLVLPNTIGITKSHSSWSRPILDPIIFQYIKSNLSSLMFLVTNTFCILHLAIVVNICNDLENYGYVFLDPIIFPSIKSNVSCLMFLVTSPKRQIKTQFPPQFSSQGKSTFIQYPSQHRTNVS